MAYLTDSHDGPPEGKDDVKVVPAPPTITLSAAIRQSFGHLVLPRQAILLHFYEAQAPGGVPGETLVEARSRFVEMSGAVLPEGSGLEALERRIVRSYRLNALWIVGWAVGFPLVIFLLLWAKTYGRFKGSLFASDIVLMILIVAILSFPLSILGLFIQSMLLRPIQAVVNVLAARPAGRSGIK